MSSEQCGWEKALIQVLFQKDDEEMDIQSDIFIKNSKHDTNRCISSHSLLSAFLLVLQPVSRTRVYEKQSKK